MGKHILLATAAAAGLLLAVSATAAEGDARLRVDQGTVMLSQGGEFTVVAGDNNPLDQGDRIMVTDGAAATVLYDEGCERKYTVPGVYTYEEVCVMPVVAPASGGQVNWTMVSAIGLGAAVVAAVVGGGSDDQDSPPVSR